MSTLWFVIGAKKLLTKIISRTRNYICNLQPRKFIQICAEITTSHRTPSALEADFTLIHQVPGKCQQYNVKIIAIKNPISKSVLVWARECPTSPELWISEGINYCSIFVHVRETPWSNDLVFENYIPVVNCLLR